MQESGGLGCSARREVQRNGSKSSLLPKKLMGGIQQHKHCHVKVVPHAACTEALEEKGWQEEIKAVSLSLLPSPHPHEPVYLIVSLVSSFLFGTVGGQEEDKQNFYRFSINILLGALIAKCSRIRMLEKM